MQSSTLTGVRVLGAPNFSVSHPHFKRSWAPQNHIINIIFDPKIRIAMIEVMRFLKSTSYDEISPNLEVLLIVLKCTTFECGLQEDAVNLQTHEPICENDWLIMIHNLSLFWNE